MPTMQHDAFGEHFANPRNVGVLAQANAVGSVGTMGWGDAVKLMLQIDPATDRIEQARFQTFGCSSAIASSSAITELITGKTTDEALEITAADVVDFLGGLPAERMYCSVMTYEAVQNAIADYRRHGAPAPAADSATICKCFGVTEAMAARTIRINHLTDPHQVTFHTKAGGGCFGCYKQVETVLARVNAEMVAEGNLAPRQAYRPGSVPPSSEALKPRGDAPPPLGSGARANIPSHIAIPPRPAPTSAAPRPVLPPSENRDRGTPEQFELIKQAVEALRPHLQRDGGDCELVDVDGNTIYLRLSGNCVDCQLASVTLSGVQAQLAEKLQRVVRVVPVS
ncbi:NifU-like protein [Rhodopseudomonas rhenobacensis]|uniref:Nitrogen fixation protein NifU n=1 Tax=Rhodopseudomonas rhenobacensis TaxID=87461 RepID=A0A7W7Z5R2_9BRAD|nr:Fe-S cluster assembly protein NifU [Rhodopseudomonas rhenobacensis]MBB5048012.1 NifU-like protein [Rhodopseudomonas rhenobacensis]